MKDGGDTVVYYSNEIGILIKTEKSEMSLHPERVIIGDSFVQAKNVGYDETFFGLLSKEIDLIAVGYSSWIFYSTKMSCAN